MQVYLVWQNDKTVLGIATSEENAQTMCTEFGDSYMLMETDIATREYVDSTPKCIYRDINGNFITYQDAIKEGYKFKSSGEND